MPALTQQQVTQFHEKGYVVVDFGLDHEALDRIVATLDPQYDPEFQQDRRRPARIQDAWKDVSEVRDLAVRTNILDALEELYGRRPLPFQTLNFPVGTAQGPHSDTIHFNSIPAGYMAGVWTALQDIDESCGPLVYYPGSHKLPVMSMQDLGLETGPEHYPEYEKAILDIIDREGLEPEYGTIRKGESLIWHSNLLHGGAPRRDPLSTRHSQVTHYYFRGCRYYTPMLSTPDKTAWRFPEWIPVTGNRSRWRSVLRRILRRH
ncbi:MAG: phytanoyl-CoA dioxygenase family protein [Pseudohongiellaceae bacterium]